MLEGIHLLKLLQNVVTAYVGADMHPKRRILDFVTTNSVWKDGQDCLNYWQPSAAIGLLRMGMKRNKPFPRVKTACDSLGGAS